LPKKLENKQIKYQQKWLDKIEHNHENKDEGRFLATLVVRLKLIY